MGAIKAAVGIAVDIAGSVIRVGVVGAVVVGITAVVALGPSGMAHADTSTDTFLLGVISAVMLFGMLIAGCVAIVSQRHSASYQPGYNDAIGWHNNGLPSLIQSHYGGLGMCKVTLTTTHARAASIGEPNPSSDSDYLAGSRDVLKRAGW
jgi:hypothetical protein